MDGNKKKGNEHADSSTDEIHVSSTVQAEFCPQFSGMKVEVFKLRICTVVCMITLTPFTLSQRKFNTNTFRINLNTLK